ncbi:hypothetical protein OAD66_09760 [Bacteroidia bacterium]|nr:hypothetical protein [Bacteroidia bacterium]
MLDFLQKYQGILLTLFGGLVAIFLLFIHNISPGIEGGMDSYNHYLIAKNTWKHPELFLDQWGKPIYNILASPFAQFGIIGMVVLNIVSLLLCAYLAWAIAEILELKYAFIAFVLTLLSPIFLDNTISSLTEPLCALLVVVTIYLLIKNQLVAGAILAGFLPYARSEGFIILFVVALYIVIIKKQYWTFFYLLAGSIVFNILGWIIEGEPLWVITQNPYINFELSGRNVCGSGGLTHYFYAGHYTFGLITCILLVIGCFAILYNIMKKQRLKTVRKMSLIILSFALFFFSHIVIWWQGMMGSCGYVRVMVVIAPLAAIIGVYALNFIHNTIRRILPKRGHRLMTLGIIFILMNALYVPYKYYNYKYPLSISAEQEQYTKLAKWYKKKNFEKRTKLYLYPYFSLIADIDPYNQKEHLDLWASSLQFTKKGDILIWDSHFGPNESGIPLNQLITDKEWVEIKQIIPTETIVTLNDAKFEIHVFEKIQ